MSEFQLSLLTIGLIVVAGVYLYGFWQQWRYRRSLSEASRESAGPSGQAATVDSRTIDDSFMDGTNGPLGGPGIDSGASAADEACGLLNDATDYVVMLLPRMPHTPGVLGALWQLRFDFGKSVHACGLNTSSGLWERLIPESAQTYRAFKLGLQLVDRSGPLSKARLEKFREVLGEIAARLQVEARLPSVEEAVQRAQQLDRFCADVDQMIGINLLTTGDRKLFGTEVESAAERQGMRLQADGTFHLLDARGVTLFNLSASDGTPFQHHTLNQSRVDSLTLLLDIPRVDKPVQRFDEMVSLAQELAKALRATMADDQRVALGEGAVAQIRARVAAIEDLMRAGHITPGSAQALRLFS